MRISTVLVLTLTTARAAVAQDTLIRPYDQLGRLDETTRYGVELVLDSARVAGLPTRPIESSALEGISKRAAGRRILIAVRGVFQSLRDARVALGPGANEAELIAAANAVRAGVPSNELARFRTARRDKSLTYPLVVLTDLITRGVPRETASSTIMQLWQRGAGDDDFLGLWRGVERDIVSGTEPGIALLNRAREISIPGPAPVAPPGPGARQEISKP